MKKRKIFFVCILFVLAIIVGYMFLHNKKSSPIEIQNFSDNQLKNTIVSAHMEEQIVKNRNVLYCSTFQLSWNEIKDFVGSDIQLDKEVDIVPLLNKGLSTKDDISDEDYLAAGGLKKDIAGKIKKELEEKFNTTPIADFSSVPDDSIIAYAYLYKNLKFIEEFESLEIPLYFRNGDLVAKVEAFGIQDYSDKNDKLRDQVDIIDYKSDCDFIISLKTEDPDKEIILARVNPGASLLETIDSVSMRVANGTIEHLSENDTLQIPKFGFNITHEYSEIIDCFLANEGYEDYLFTEALQNISFVLDERGAVLESHAFISFTKSASPISKQLIFNGPFLIYMKEKDGQYPYFALWVENEELMTLIND